MSRRSQSVLLPRNSRTVVVGIVARISGCKRQKEVSLEDQVDHAKEEVGRTYVGLLRHQLLTAVTHLFLSRMTLQGREKKSPVNRLPDAHRLQCDGAIQIAPFAHRATPA